MKSGKISVLKGDIVKENVQAIVNAANTSLLGGGGVDGAIHKAAGPELLEFCEKLGGCLTGDAKISPGFQLPAKYVIHTVGPVWRGGSKNEDEMLTSCYGRCFQLAEEYQIETLAFPAISTGVYRFPVERATKIACRETQKALAKYPVIKEVRFVCFNGEVYSAYAGQLLAAEA